MRLREDIGLNIVGYICAESGVGEAARCSARAALHEGIQTALIDFREGCVSRMAENIPKASCNEPKHEVTLLHINADQIMEQALILSNGLLSGKYNIGYWLWETTDFPDKWVAGVQLRSGGLDVVLILCGRDQPEIACPGHSHSPLCRTSPAGRGFSRRFRASCEGLRVSLHGRFLECV